MGKNKRILFAALLVIAAGVAFFAPGCDKLITEVNDVTIAGHPEADFTATNADGENLTACCVPCTVYFADASNGPHDLWEWAFGDGDTVNDTNPVHVYDSAGLYTVSLRIQNTPTEGEDIEIKHRLLAIGQTLDSFTIEPDSGCPGLEVSFTPFGYAGVTSWHWNFGDGGTSNDSFPTHFYGSVGDFTVTLTVQGGCGQKVVSVTDGVSITNCPDANVYVDTDVTPLTGCVPHTVQFFDSSDTKGRPVIGRLWDFGNDQTDTAKNPLVEYDTAGIYTVSLAVTTDSGTGYDSLIDYITVYDSTTAAFAATSPTSDCYSDFQQFIVAFSDSSSNGVTSWNWDFGDGFTSTVQNPAHAYITPGRYSVTLAVDGSCGPDTAVQADLITLYDSLETVTIDINPATGDTTTSFIMTDLSPGIIDSRLWFLGFPDSVSTQSQDTIKFAEPNDYNIILEITNGCNRVTDTVVLTVTAGP
jgi:PKD repeat protein